MLGLPGLFFSILAFRNDDFENHRLTFRDEIPLVPWQAGEQRQFQSLHDRLDASQMMAADGNLMGGKDQLEILFVAVTI